MSFARAVIAGAFALVPSLTHAEPPEAATAHACVRLRAEAASRAALLRSPSVRVQGLHLPGQGDADGLGFVQREGYQARALAEWPLVDLYRAGRLETMAEAKCEALAAQLEVERTLAVGNEIGMLTAARAILRELSAHEVQVASIVAESERRRAAGVVTALEHDQLRLLVLALAERRARAEEDVSRLSLRPAAASSLHEVERMLERHARAAGEGDQEASRLRRAEALHVDVAGGVIPQREVDWFASLSLAYDLGGFAQARHETRALAAAAAERREAEYELAGRVSLLRRELEARATTLDTSLDILDAKQSMLIEQRTRLERGEPEEALTLRAKLDLELIANAAERAYLSALLQESVTFLAEVPHG